MVGDNPERDVQGGINAGMKTCWVDRGFRARGVRADYEVKDLRGCSSGSEGGGVLFGGRRCRTARVPLASSAS